MTKVINKEGILYSPNFYACRMSSECAVNVIYSSERRWCGG